MLGAQMAGEGPDAAGRVVLVWDDELATYDFGDGHPLDPIRVELTIELVRSLGLLDGVGAVEIGTGTHEPEDLLRVHRPDFIRAVERVSGDPGLAADLAHGLGPGDNPVFAGMHEASLHVVAASKEAARQVWEGEADHAFNPSGGLHHAMPDKAAGFCVYNDPAVAIDWLLEHGAERIAYVDIDVHHGDGVEVIFADDPRVLTMSLHESGRFLFPGTGASDDIGGPGAPGSALNLPMMPATTGDLWLRAFDAAVEPLVRAFSPDILVTQLGCDTHATDPLAHLGLTVDDYAAIVARLHRLAHEAADGRWLATGGGGYQLVQVVPRAWTIAFAEMSGARLPVETPMAWREIVTRRTGQRAPTSFHDDPVTVSEPMRAQAVAGVEQAIDAARRLVLPHHGVRG
jgi:acetoin utilization protein AcuC